MVLDILFVGTFQLREQLNQLKLTETSTSLDIIQILFCLFKNTVLN